MIYKYIKTYTIAFYVAILIFFSFLISIIDTKDALSLVKNDVSKSYVLVRAAESAHRPLPINTPSLKAFPGAEGFGSETIGGRGGKIIKVTTLRDTGSGSLRWALSTSATDYKGSAVESGPRIIVFEVAGYITLNSNLEITIPYVTIAGQTAPSPGVTIRGWGLKVLSHDVVVQHLRFRPGVLKRTVPPYIYDNLDSLQVTANAYNVVIDHCSGSWSHDECMSTWGRGTHDVTFSNCIIAESIDHNLHREVSHSKGLLLGDDTERNSVIKCYVSHHMDRMPHLKRGVSAAIVNNVFYNTGNISFFGVVSDDTASKSSCKIALVGNTFKAGPNTSKGVYGFAVSSTVPAGTLIYQNDNQGVGIKTPFGWGGRAVGRFAVVDDFPTDTKPPNIKILPSVEAVPYVLTNAGARPIDRDSVDARVIKDYSDGDGSIINHEDDVGGFPNLKEIYRPFSVPQNYNDIQPSGYTKIEEILHTAAAAVEGKAYWETINKVP